MRSSWSARFWFQLGSNTSRRRATQVIAKQLRQRPLDQPRDTTRGGYEHRIFRPALHLPARTDDLFVSVMIRCFRRVDLAASGSGSMQTHDSVRVEFESTRAVRTARVGSRALGIGHSHPAFTNLPLDAIDAMALQRRLDDIIEGTELNNAEAKPHSEPRHCSDARCRRNSEDPRPYDVPSYAPPDRRESVN
jgi:hypothetical protein